MTMKGGKHLKPIRTEARVKVERTGTSIDLHTLVGIL